MTDQATTPVSPVQSIAAPQQNAPYPIVERSQESETPQNGQTAKKSKSAPFNKQTARMYALRSWEARRAKQQAIAQASQPPVQPQALPPAYADNFTTKSLERVKKQLEAIDDALDKAKDGREWDQLSRAKERLFRAWVHLAGIPGPGNLRPVASNRRRAAPSDLAPLPISPTDGQ